jgi:hypothetical protein
MDITARSKLPSARLSAVVVIVALLVVVIVVVIANLKHVVLNLINSIAWVVWIYSPNLPLVYVPTFNPLQQK